MSLKWSINHTLPCTPNAGGSQKMWPGSKWSLGAEPQTSSDSQKQRRKTKFNLPQVVPQLSWRRKHLWVYPATKAFVGCKLFHFSLCFLEHCILTPMLSFFLYSHKNLLRHRASSLATLDSSLEAGPILIFPYKPQLGWNPYAERDILAFCCLAQQPGTCWNKLQLCSELDVARGGHRGAEHDDLRRDALN